MRLFVNVFGFDLVSISLVTADKFYRPVCVFLFLNFIHCGFRICQSLCFLVVSLFAVSGY